MHIHVISKTVLVASLGLLLPTISLGLETAAMKLPPGFRETAVRLPVDGYDGFNRGRFAVDRFSGDFSRVETRLAIFDPLYASNRGSASFTMTGPGIDGTVSAECSFKQKVGTAGIVTLDLKKLAFVCEIAGVTGEMSGRLTLGEPKPQGFKQRFLARAMRRGVAQFGSMTIEMESIHEYEGSRFQSQVPVGYLLTANSAVVGALELTDVNPTIFIADDVSEPSRLLTLITAIAVSLLRDPADSALAD